VASVAWISVSPVKGLALRQLDECELTEAGVAGDRAFFLVDDDDRLVNSKGLGGLQQIVPRFEADVLELLFPDGTKVADQVAVDGSLDAQFWGVAVPVRVVVGPWSEAISDFSGRSLRLVRPPGPATDRMRSGAATLLGTASLRAIARISGVDEVDGRRFRMNFGVEGLREARPRHAEGARRLPARGRDDGATPVRRPRGGRGSRPGARRRSGRAALNQSVIDWLLEGDPAIPGTLLVEMALRVLRSVA